MGDVRKVPTRKEACDGDGKNGIHPNFACFMERLPRRPSVLPHAPALQ
jgi:hypothetical protein